jgi:hypothetical protein
MCDFALYFNLHPTLLVVYPAVLNLMKRQCNFWEVPTCIRFVNILKQEMTIGTPLPSQSVIHFLVREQSLSQEAICIHMQLFLHM